MSPNWKEHYYYDETSPSCLMFAVDKWSGEFRHHLSAAKDTPVGSIHKESGYWGLKCEGKSYKGHRVVWEIVNGPIPPKMIIDHINMNKSDNRISNLRLVDDGLSARNRPMQKSNTSGVVGVTRITPDPINIYWRARWCPETGVRKHKDFSVNTLGEEEAFKQACEYRKLKMEEYAHLGYTKLHGTKL